MRVDRGSRNAGSSAAPLKPPVESTRIISLWLRDGKNNELHSTRALVVKRGYAAETASRSLIQKRIRRQFRKKYDDKKGRAEKMEGAHGICKLAKESLTLFLRNQSTIRT